MSGSLEHIVETMVVPQLSRIADALEELVDQAKPITDLVKQAIEESIEENRPGAAQRPAPPRVPRRL